MSDYTVDYFLEKFEAIPEEKWCVGLYKIGDSCCAAGHCGMSAQSVAPPEAWALIHMFADGGLGVGSVNDGEDNEYPQPTPKQRILAALRDIKARQEGK